MNFILQDAIMGLVGGLMIGIAAALMLLVNGRIAGISGITASILRASGNGVENLAFLGGMIVAPLIAALLWFRPDIGISTQPLLLIAGGLLVGFGTRLGSGCTSGHGVCGMSRFSPRSIAATLVFMAAGIAVASLVTPMLGAG